MTGPGCHKKHTPIVSEAQRRLFGAVAGGKETKATGLSQVEAKRHLKEASGKKLEERVQKRLDKTFRKGKRRG